MEEQATENIKKELDGKTKEELEAMVEENINKLRDKINVDANTYVWNLMELGNEFSNEAYSTRVEEYVKDYKEKNQPPFTNWDDEMFMLNTTILRHGYGAFGKNFIECALAKDPASAVVLFETAVQAYLDTTYDYECLIDQLRLVAATKEKEGQENKENQ